MNLSKAKLYREVCKAALAFHERQIWKDVPGRSIFALRLPDQPHPLFASIMGSAGEQFGLSLTRGPTAGSDMLRIGSGDDDPEFRDRVDLLGFSIDPLADVPTHRRRVLEKAGMITRRDALVPFFIARPPGGPAREINQAEALIFLFAINAILKADDQGVFRSRPAGESTLVLSVSGDPLAPDIAISHETLLPPVIRDADEGDPTVIPAEDDLAGWKAADLRASKRLGEGVTRNLLAHNDMLEEYFGVPPKRALELLRRQKDMGAPIAYMDWLSTDYREAEDSPTVAERLIRDASTPEAERRILSARAKAAPCLYRVEKATPDGRLRLTNALFGGEIEVRDRALADSLLQFPSVCLFARCYPAGKFHFLSMSGPCVPGHAIDEAMALLERRGMKFTAAGLARDAHLFGHLWDLHDRRSRDGAMPTLTNTDGDPLEWQTASFSVANERALIEALTAHPGVDRDERDGCFSWHSETTPDVLPSCDRVHLARLELVGGELIAEVNSAKRLKNLRKWLDKIPGVKFQRTEAKSVEEMMKNRPLDNVLNPPKPAEMTPELLEFMRNKMRDHYMRWIDMELPMFDGKSPREMCRTPQGRARVAASIRSIPEPIGQNTAGPVVPRQEMLKALGLE